MDTTPCCVNATQRILFIALPLLSSIGLAKNGVFPERSPPPMSEGELLMTQLRHARRQPLGQRISVLARFRSRLDSSLLASAPTHPSSTPARSAPLPGLCVSVAHPPRTPAPTPARNAQRRLVFRAEVLRARASGRAGRCAAPCRTCFCLTIG